MLAGSDLAAQSEGLGQGFADQEGLRFEGAMRSLEAPLANSRARS
jgi:hypothetical protein